MSIRAVRLTRWCGVLAAAAVLAVPTLASAAAPGRPGGGEHFARVQPGGHIAAPRASIAPRVGAMPRLGSAPRFAAPRMGATPRFGATPRAAATPQFRAPRINAAPHFNAAPRFGAAPRITSPPHLAAAPRPGEGHAAITPHFGATPRLGNRGPVGANHAGAAPARNGHGDHDLAWTAHPPAQSGRDPAWRGHTSNWNTRNSGWRNHGGHNGWIAQPRWTHPHHSWYGPKWGYHRYWNGGWWQGYYWPRAYYGWSFPWFLATLPVGYATFWWSGIPYYYVNSVYYVWNADDNGYIVTDPPPIESSATTDVSTPADSDDAAVDDSAGAAPSAGPDDIYMYPENGQSEAQQAKDRYECHKWAQDQTGFDPSEPNGGSASASPDDYRRAMIACLDARGYSAK